MRWLADECVDASLVARLRAAGHDVSYMAEIARSASDLETLQRARDEARLLLTEDKDFGELVFRGRFVVPGVVVLRIAPEQRSLKWDRLEAAIARHGTAFFGRYVVIGEARLRSRPMPA